VTDFLDDKRHEITERLKELKPFVDEFTRLEAAVAALAKVGGSAAAARASAAPARRRGPGRPRGSVNRAKAAAATATATAPAAPAKPKAKRKKAGRPGRPPGRRRVGRRKGSGTRAAEALAFVQGQPGLQQEGKVTKQGRGWLPKS